MEDTRPYFQLQLRAKCFLKACNARICGTYHLVGVREGRPLYLLPGKKAVIRYAPELDRPGRYVDMLWVSLCL